MKVAILDDNHIKIVASPSEVERYSNHDAIFIDNKDTFTCNSEPGSGWSISRPEGGSLFNVPLDISTSPFTTKEFLIVYVQLSDLTYPVVMPTYNNNELIELVAINSGVLSQEFDGVKKGKVQYIVLYYAFKLSCVMLDINKAISFWNKLHNKTNTNINCKCNG